MILSAPLLQFCIYVSAKNIYPLYMLAIIFVNIYMYLLYLSKYTYDNHIKYFLTPEINHLHIYITPLNFIRFFILKVYHLRIFISL